MTEGPVKKFESGFVPKIFDKGKDYTGWVWGVLKDELEKRGIDASEAKVLDVACGTGRSTRGLIHDGFDKKNVIGVDPDSEMLAQARSRDDSIDYQLMEKTDPPELKFPDASFDVVAIYSAFNYFGNDERMMNEIRRVLKPEGICMVITAEVGWFTKAGRKLINKYVHQASEPSPRSAPVGQSSERLLKEKYGFTEVTTYDHEFQNAYFVEDAIRVFDGARGRRSIRKEDLPKMEKELREWCKQLAEEDRARGGEGIIKQTGTLIVDIARK